MEVDQERAEKLVSAADKLLLQAQALMDGTPALTAQALKHLSGVLKDIRDLQTLRQEPGAQSVTVVLEGAVDGYGK